MLSLDPQSLWTEIEAAEKLRDRHLSMTREFIGRYVGNYYRDDFQVDPTPENYPAAYAAFVLPQLVYERPRATVTANRSVTDAAVAEAMELALNHWGKEIQVKKLLQSLAVDLIFGFGVVKVGLEHRGSHKGASSRALSMVHGDTQLTEMMPYAKRIAPSCSLIDAFCDSPNTARLIGHKFERDLDDLKQDGRYDAEVVAKLTANDRGDKPADSPFSRRETTNRQRITLYELYLPEHGMLLTITPSCHGTPQIVRQSEYYGPDEGPFMLFGAYTVPDQVYPLSPIAATWAQFLELQDHSTAMADSAASHKKIGLYESSNKQDAERIKTARPGDLVGVQNMGAVKDFEIGGASPQQYQYVEVLRDRMDRSLGFTDAQRGQAENVTATAANIASGNSDMRLDFLRQRMTDGAQDIYSRVAWYFYYEKSVAMILSVEDEATGEKQQFTYLGGNDHEEGMYFEESTGVQRYDQQQAMKLKPEQLMAGKWFGSQKDTDWTDLHLEIDPMSMVKTDSALEQKRSQDAVTLMASLAPLIPSTPNIRWKYLLNKYGAAQNWKNFGDEVLDMDVTMPNDDGGDGGMLPPDTGMGGEAPMDGGAGMPGLIADARG